MSLVALSTPQTTGGGVFSSVIERLVDEFLRGLNWVSPGGRYVATWIDTVASTLVNEVLVAAVNVVESPLVGLLV